MKLTDNERRTEPVSFPVLIHCQVGKDRTGFVFGLLLSLAGVPDETIAHDYGLSAPNLVPLFTKIAQEFAHLDNATAQQVMGSDADIMRSLLDTVRQEYGNVEGYLQAVGIEDEVVTAVRQQLVQ